MIKGCCRGIVSLKQTTDKIQSNLDILKLNCSLQFEISVFQYNRSISADAVGHPVKVWHTTGNKILQQAYPFPVILREQI